MVAHTSKNINRQPMMALVSDKQRLLMQSLTPFFTTTSQHGNKGGINPHMQQFLEQTGKGAPISLRVIDWFVTNYSREHNVSYINKRTGLEFNVHKEYKACLKSNSKRQFDPFCRRNRINFYYREDAKIQTTVGQLNFFRWAIENHVLDYIHQHLADIEKAMRVYVRSQREEKKNNDGDGSNTRTSNANSVMINKGGLMSHSKTRRRGNQKYSTDLQTSCGGTYAKKTSETVHPSHKNHMYTHRAAVTVSFS